MAPSDGGADHARNPDALTGADHLVELCNSGAPVPPATRESAVLYWDSGNRRDEVT